MFEYEMTWAGEMGGETQQIARGLRRRDVAVLHGLIEQYQYRLVRYLIYLMGRRDEVDDLAQETWLRVLERGSSYDSCFRFEPWLFTIARNLAFDRLRKRCDASLDSSDEDNPEAMLPLTVSSASSPFADAARTEDAKRLACAMQSLQPIHREVLVLRFQEDLSLQEISEIVKAPLTTVASRIYRALALLRVQLEEVDHAN
jgi:RNA polymerase sigma-70 factor (ECF subfamily)